MAVADSCFPPFFVAISQTGGGTQMNRRYLNISGIFFSPDCNAMNKWSHCSLLFKYLMVDEYLPMLFVEFKMLYFFFTEGATGEPTSERINLSKWCSRIPVPLSAFNLFQAALLWVWLHLALPSLTQPGSRVPEAGCLPHMPKRFFYAEGLQLFWDVCYRVPCASTFSLLLSMITTKSFMFSTSSSKCRQLLFSQVLRYFQTTQSIFIIFISSGVIFEVGSFLKRWAPDPQGLNFFYFIDSDQRLTPIFLFFRHWVVFDLPHRRQSSAKFSVNLSLSQIQWTDSRRFQTKCVWRGPRFLSCYSAGP